MNADGTQLSEAEKEAELEASRAEDEAFRCAVIDRQCRDALATLQNSGLDRHTDHDWSIPGPDGANANIGGGTVGFCDRGEWTPAQLRALATLAENS